MPPLATLTAPAKINLSLRILGRRSDGYHLLDSLFLPVAGFHDTLVLRKGEPGTGCVMNPPLPGVPLERNLVYKAWAGYAAATGFAPDISVELVKRIPTGAGLGGGSSDAAALLRWLQEQAGDKALRTEELNAVAVGIGADVPFFLLGSPASAQGIGEVLTPVFLDLSLLTLVVACPDQHVSSAWAYQEWDRLNQTSPIIPEQEFLTSLETTHKRRVSLLPATVGNDFERVVFPAYPDLPRIKEQLLRHGAACSAMSGSGASIFALFRNDGLAQNAVQALRANGMLVHVEALTHWGVAKR